MPDTKLDTKPDRTDGRFLTPPDVATICHRYIVDIVGPNVYSDNIWDPCCGTGNLVGPCPDDMRDRLVLTTISEADVKLLRRTRRGLGNVIAVDDFLDDDTPSRVARRLFVGGAWTFVMNPPFIAAAGAMCSSGADAPMLGRTSTPVALRMKDEGLGSASVNTIAQFVHQVDRICTANDIEPTICLLANTNILVGPQFDAFREWMFARYDFSGGFCFPSTEFEGVRAAWPATFTVWHASIGGRSPDPTLDVIEDGVKIGTKTFAPPRSPLHSLIGKPRAVRISPPMGSEIPPAARTNARCDKLAEDGFAYIRYKGNDNQRNHMCYITSGPNHDGGGWSITPDNFEAALSCLAVRRLSRPTWLNWNDQFGVPVNMELWDEFVPDAVAWMLVHPKNRACSVGNVPYDGRTFDIRNGMFWIHPEAISTATCPLEIAADAVGATPAFAFRWIEANRHRLSKPFSELIDEATELVLRSLPLRMDPPPHLGRWDAGLSQIRDATTGGCLTELSEPCSRLGSLVSRLGRSLATIIPRLGVMPEVEPIHL